MLKKPALKIVGVCGSPRRGNTEWMLEKLCQALRDGGAEVDVLLLRRLDVKMCRGCLSCEKGGQERQGGCVIQDDMAAVYPKLLAADVILLATPCYMGLLSGLLKNFLDRTCAIWPRLAGKRLAGLAAAEETRGRVIRDLKFYAELLKMRWMGSVIAFAKNPGDAALKTGLQSRLQKLAQKILAP